MTMEDDAKQSMTLNQDTVLAYSVNELKVDLNDGTCHVVLDREGRGGFHGGAGVENFDVLGNY